MKDTDPKQEKKELILSSAALCFSRKGFAGTRMEDIAEAAGVGKGTIYEYVKNKEELLFGVYQWYVAEMLGILKVVSFDPLAPVSEKLLHLAEKTIRVGMQNIEMFTLVFEFWAASRSGKNQERFRHSIRETYQKFRMAVSELILEGMEQKEFHGEIDVHGLSASLVGMWDALLLQYWFEKDFDPLGALHAAMEELLLGMKSRQ